MLMKNNNEYECKSVECSKPKGDVPHETPHCGDTQGDQGQLMNKFLVETDVKHTKTKASLALA